VQKSDKVQYNAEKELRGRGLACIREHAEKEKWEEIVIINIIELWRNHAINIGT
jgi:hypothetical protein